MRRSIVLVGANILIILVLLEGALRLFPSIVPTPFLYHFEPDLRTRIAQGRLPTVGETVLLERDDGGFPLRIWKPGVTIRHNFEDEGAIRDVTMDEAGFCNEPGSFSGGPADIVTLGDSFTWCMSVHPHQTWTSRLAGLTGAQTYNLGKDGVGPYEYEQILKQFGLQMSPQVVIMNLYEGNDLRDAVKYEKYRASLDAEGEKDEWDNYRGAIYRFLDEGPIRRTSYAFNLVAAAITFASRSVHPRPNFRYDLLFDHGHVAFNSQNTDTDEILHARLLDAKEISLRVMDEALEDFAALAERHDFQPIVAYTPSAHTSYEDFVRYKEDGIDDLLEAYSARQRAYLTRKLDQLGVTFIDLTPVFQEKAREHTEPDELLYYPSNLHLTRFGHLVVAEAMADTITFSLAARPSESPNGEGPSLN